MANIDAILSDVQSFFDEKINTSEKIKELYRAVRDGTATYTEANEYALEVGNLLAKAYKNKLPTDKLYEYEEAIGLLKEPLHKNYEMIAEYCETVQKAINQSVGMNLNAVKPPLEEERIEGIAKAVSEADTPEKALSLFDDPIQTFSQHVVDSSVRENADFHSEIGLKPKIIRKYEGGHFRRGKFVDCKWCKNLAGVYNYEDVKNKGNDVYRRHAGCRCTIEYDPGDGKKKVIYRNKANSAEPSNDQNYLPINRSVKETFISKTKEIVASKIDGYNNVYVEDGVKIKPKALHDINRNIEKAISFYGEEGKPKVVIASKESIGYVLGKYDCVTDTMYVVPELADKTALEKLSTKKDKIIFGFTEAHEAWHWKQRQSYHFDITEENRDEYMNWLNKKCKQNVAKLGITEYNVDRISDYASDAYEQMRFDEVEAEYRAFEMIRKG